MWQIHGIPPSPVELEPSPWKLRLKVKKKLFTFLKLQIISDYSGRDSDSCPNIDATSGTESTSTTTGPITQNNNTNTNNTEENHKGMNN